MRKLIYLSFCVLMLQVLFVGCRRHDANASKAAERYYGYLAKGDVDKYMRGMADYDSLPEEYREQLHNLFQQYIDHEKEARKGILSAQALRDTLISDDQAHVFLLVTYGDSTQEQVSLPLVLTDKGWRMR
ncbi:MAG: DUF4878 domain-containing protein [Bacteroidaceae bacterium]|nr:DUF4878 domain-containing protein [Bacteroidaceae bacterium]